MKVYNRLTLAALTIAVLAACQPDAPATAPAAPADATAATPAPVSAEPAAAPLPTDPTAATPAVVVPGSLDNCDVAQVVTVRWNFDLSGQKVELVDVFVGRNDAEMKLFVTGPSNGESETGPWVLPGTSFVLKDHTSAEELGRVTVAGPTCPGV